MIVLMEGARKGELAARGQGLGLHPHHPPWCLPALRGPWETRVLVLAPPLSVFGRTLPWGSIFPFEKGGQAEVVEICQGMENSIAQGFQAHSWSLAAQVQHMAPLFTSGVTLGRYLTFLNLCFFLLKGRTVITPPQRVVVRA